MTTEKPLIDWARTLEKVVGDAELLDSVSEAVLEECPELLRQIDESLQGHDARTLKRGAHTIKGSFRLFDIEPIESLATQLEKLARRKAYDEVPGVLQPLRALLARACDEIAAWRDDYAAESETKSASDDASPRGDAPPGGDGNNAGGSSTTRA